MLVSLPIQSFSSLFIPYVFFCFRNFLVVLQIAIDVHIFTEWMIISLALPRMKIAFHTLFFPLKLQMERTEKQSLCCF